MFEGARELIRQRGVNWWMAIYITLVHVLAVVGLFYVPACKWQTLAWAFTLWPISGVSVTAGLHRMWSHRSYTGNLPYRIMMMILASVANQGSIVRWSGFEHKIHHMCSEEPADPHNAKLGLFYAHMGWLYVKRPKEYYDVKKTVNIDHLLNDGPVMWQLKYDPWFSWLMCFVGPMMIASYGWGESMVNGFFVPGVVRYVYVLHCTWSVNGISHLYGHRPYDEKINPAENWVSGILSLGEGGGHNWHHTYPFDYNNKEFGWMGAWNPTSMWIDFFASIGWVTNRKTGVGAWALKKKKIDEEKLKLNDEIVDDTRVKTA